MSREVAVLLLSFLCEYIDSTLGMGYGTTLTPALLLLGFSPHSVVPAVLTSELATGLVGGVLHSKAGNIKLSSRSRDTRVALVLASCSSAGSVAAVALALSTPAAVIKLYIGLLALSMGVLMLSGYRSKTGFSWRRTVALGLLSSFNKALSGGGYGPVVVGGQLLSGIEGKRAVGTAALAEGLTCLAALAAYTALGSSRSVASWSLTIPLTLGALASTPLAAYSVKKVEERRLEKLMGLAVSLIGIATAAKAVSSLR
ncbi:MAG: hypothetical protein DRN96_05860 [Thermoproteota archaeon]|nr:MAG: hypothetical protein DRN96_05860 [Candidatus Korarchaeota archaeon]RLG55511.1 MAG: hypothetical protein DRN99_02405 [Candidatus Korarchaeota archaeon]